MRAHLLRLGAVLVLLAGCASSDEMPPPFDPAAAAGAQAGTDAQGVAGDGIDSSELPPGVMPGSQEDLEITVGDRVFFGFDTAVLSPVAAETLDRQAVWLKRYPDVIVTIEGHADERGTREYNLALGDRRANAVKNYLVALEIEPERITTISYGEERPDDAGHDETAWAKNRRAVTVVSTAF
jgi:peptidoglycan-associated lipoprotein